MIKMTNVCHQYQSQPTLQDISVTIGQGELVYVVGQSGAGKSTLIKLIYNEEIASSGEISVAGYDLMGLKNEERHHFRQQVGIIFQDYKLLERYTVRENLAYPLQVMDLSEKLIRERVTKMLAFVELSAGDNFPAELSGGEQQRVAIARALITNPQVLVADEPTGNLDPKNSRMILRLLEKISQSGTTVLMVTHDQSLIEQFPQRMLTILKGQLVADSQPIDWQGK